MKKYIAILLIAICCVSLFAADVSGEVRINVGVSEKGFEFRSGVLGIGYNATADKAKVNSYIDYVFKPESNWNGLGVHVDLEFQPIESVFFLKAGTESFINFADFNNSDCAAFARAQYVDSETLSNAWLEFGCDSPILDLSNKTYFAYAEANTCFGEDKDNQVDAAAIINFRFDNGKFDVSLFNAEVACYLKSRVYSRSGSSIGVPGIHGLNFNWISSSNWDTVEAEYLFGTSWDSYAAEHRGIAVRYKYSKDNTPEENGFFGFVEATNHKIPLTNEAIDNQASFTATLEFGRSMFNAEAGFYVIKPGKTDYPAIQILGDVKLNGSYGKDNFDVDVNYAGVKASSTGYFKGTPGEEDSYSVNGKLQLEYFNSEERTERDNGLFLTTFFDGNVGSAAIQPMFRIGLNKFDGTAKPVFDFNSYSSLSF